jgi:predicted GNAT superfamily acetyltransferase
LAAWPCSRASAAVRLIAQWWIRTDRVARRIAPDGGPAVRDVSAIDDAWRVNVLRRDGRWPACDRLDLTRSDSRLVVEIPTGFTELQASEPELAREWRQATREIFTTNSNARTRPWSSSSIGQRVLDDTCSRASSAGP